MLLNLVFGDECWVLVGVGVDDWGGVLLLMFDYVNFEWFWFVLDELVVVIVEVGYDMV